MVEPAEDQRNMQYGVVEQGVLERESVLADQLPVIGGDHQQSVIERPRRIQSRQYLSNLVVRVAHAGVVKGFQVLRFALRQGAGAEKMSLVRSGESELESSFVLRIVSQRLSGLQRVVRMLEVNPCKGGAEPKARGERLDLLDHRGLFPGTGHPLQLIEAAEHLEGKHSEV